MEKEKKLTTKQERKRVKMNEVDEKERNWAECNDTVKALEGQKNM